MMDKIMVSICCLAYNHEKYIRDALEGLVNQKVNFGIEILVHDDTSTDGTVDIIMEYVNKYPDIVKPILQKENQYSKKEKDMLEYIFPYMNGKYVALCEGDDYWSDMNKIQRQVDFLEQNPEYAGCAHNSMWYDMVTGEKKAMYDESKDRIVGFKDVLRGSGGYQTGALLYPYSILQEYIENRPPYVNPPLKIGACDTPKNIFISLQGDIYCFKEIMSVYRFQSEGSWSSMYITDNKERKKEYLEAKREMFRILLEEVPKNKHRYVLKEYSKYERENILSMAENQDKKGIVRNRKLIRHYSFYLQVYIVVRTYFNSVYLLYRKLRYGNNLEQ